VEEQILSLYKVFSQKWMKEQNSENPILQRDKHSAFLRRGLSQLSDAYEVSSLISVTSPQSQEGLVTVAVI